MIYTVTFNPALDYIVGTEQMRTGQINRTEYETISYGGKGINVSIMLNHLKVQSVAMGFVAGFTGEEIERRVKAEGVRTDFIHLSDGMSRINVKIKAQEETEINGQGPTISNQALNELFAKIDQLQEEDVLVLAGSIPKSLPDDSYGQIMAKIQSKKVRVVVDATKDLLKNVLKYHPFLIKPNNDELGELLGISLKTEEEIVEAAKKLQSLGARNVLVSMAGDGAILLEEQGNCYRIQAPEGEVKNSVGAGDSMVAGFLAGYLQKGDYEEALLLGAAAGSATAFSVELGTQEMIHQLLERMKKPISITNK